MQFSYRSAENKLLARPQSGRHQVKIMEEKRVTGYDFDRREWFNI
jgi:hypothetical protein